MGWLTIPHEEEKRYIFIQFLLYYHKRIWYKIVSIHSYRGGTGKSNLTANLAAKLAMVGHKVGIVDSDIQSPGLHLLFGLDDDKINLTLNDYLWGKCDLKDAVYDVSEILGTISGKGNIYLIPSSMKLDAIATVLNDGYDVELLQEGLDGLSELLGLDYLLIDTHPGLNEETLLSIGISNTLIIILRPDRQDYQGTAVILEVAEQLDVPEILLVINKALPEMNLDALKQKVEETYNQKVAGVLPLSSEMLRLGSEGIFCLQYPDNQLILEFNRIISSIKFPTITA